MVEETGFCDTCARRPLAVSVEPVTMPLSQSEIGPELLSLPVFEFPDPSSRILSNPRVPERDRTCANCRAEVGRSYAGRPGLSEGYCDQCGHPYSFLPNLRPGDLVANQYEVTGCFARGGLGWIYLAEDTNLKDRVVLKGLIDIADAPLAQAELRALTMMDHPNIVRVLNFVSHPDARTGELREYIVMEYVDGLVLSDVIRQCEKRGAPLGEPLRVEHVIVCGLQILAALDYLHGRELLYCDMKPDNVIIRSGQHQERVNRVKLIDLGAVRKIGDRVSKIIGTEGYQVDRAEIDERGLTVRSDIHAFGVTLDELFKVTVDWAEKRAGISRVETGLRSFERLIARATHKDPDRRFASAAQLVDQLTGVHREIAALRDGRERAEPSRVFAPAVGLLDAGIGSVPPLDRWLSADEHPPLTGLPPAASTAVVSLPTPLPDPADPAAGFLTDASNSEPRQLLDKLSALESTSVEAELSRCRAWLELGEVDRADASARLAGELLGAAADRDWRVSWHNGLLALVRGEFGAARNAFNAVYSALPGEQAPKLALGYCDEADDEADDDDATAEELYQAVWRRDRLQAGAAFGLARIQLANGDRTAAVTVLSELPKVSRHADAAAIATVTVLCGRLGSSSPSRADLHKAAGLLPGVYLDGGDDRGPARDRLTTLVREAALDWVREHDQPLPVDGGPVFGDRPDERALRELLMDSYRALAQQARDADSYGVLLDRAHAIRQMTFL
jgi:serine/threonine-protein kinase PknG